MTMYATIRGADGSSLGSIPVDPSAPGGINAQVNAAMQQMQQNGTIPRGQQPSPHRPHVPQHNPNSYAQATIKLRFVANGQWSEMVAPCPPGVPPGTYVLVGSR